MLLSKTQKKYFFEDEELGKGLSVEQAIVYISLTLFVAATFISSWHIGYQLAHWIPVGVNEWWPHSPKMMIG